MYSIQCNSQDSTYLIKQKDERQQERRRHNSNNIVIIIDYIAPSLIALVHSFDLDLNLDLIVIPPALYSKDNTNDMGHDNKYQIL